ncbi:hypothetical protein PAPYR_13360 [Paratrimastix pyriformis]|uniref:Uncharacterized protein n=1 Tax=Paratrimastix pyriformis TaxID=342808 RepID=A0ABQ8U6Q7_9EUKA|nr:hypothetical protein PAPYR_13360 [Paratrimastix pyriformis]
MEWIWKPLKAAVARNTHSGVFIRKLYILAVVGHNLHRAVSVKLIQKRACAAGGRVNSDRYSHSATVLGDNLYFRWQRFFKRLNELWEYSFVKRSWSEIRVGSPRRHTSHSVVAHNDCLYVFGGLFTAAGQPDRFYNDLYEFSPALRRWTLLRSTGYSHHPGLPQRGCAEHRMLVLGHQRCGKSNALWSYSFESREWSLVNVTGPCPEPRFCHTAVVSENAMYVFGGNSEVGSMNDLWSFDGNQEQWRCLQTVGVRLTRALLRTRCWCTAVFTARCLGDLYALRMVTPPAHTLTDSELRHALGPIPTSTDPAPPTAPPRPRHRPPPSPHAALPPAAPLLPSASTMSRVASVSITTTTPPVDRAPTPATATAAALAMVPAPSPSSAGSSGGQVDEVCRVRPECPVVSTLTADLLAMTDDWATADSFIACPASHAMVTAHGSLIRIRCRDLVPFLVPRLDLLPVSQPLPRHLHGAPPATAAGVIAATAIRHPGLDPPIPSSCIVNCPPEALAGLPDCEIEAPLLRYLLGFLYADHIPLKSRCRELRGAERPGGAVLPEQTQGRYPPMPMSTSPYVAPNPASSSSSPP